MNYIKRLRRIFRVSHGVSILNQIGQSVRKHRKEYLILGAQAKQTGAYYLPVIKKQARNTQKTLSKQLNKVRQTIRR